MTTANTNTLVRLAREARRAGDRAKAVEFLGEALGSVTEDDESDDEDESHETVAVVAPEPPAPAPRPARHAHASRVRAARDPYATARTKFNKPAPGNYCTSRRPLTAAETALVESHIHLVAEVAERCAHKFPWSFDANDRESAAAFGLLDAARTWTPDGGASFVTHAKRRMLGEILDAARKQDWVPRAERARERATGVAPVDMLVQGPDPDAGEKAAVKFDGADPRPVCSVERDRIEAADEVRAALARAQLDYRDRMVLALRAEGRSLAAVGAELGVSESRACQLERRAVNAVRWWHGLGDDETTHTRFGRGSS